MPMTSLTGPKSRSPFGPQPTTTSRRHANAVSFTTPRVQDGERTQPGKKTLRLHREQPLDPARVALAVLHLDRETARRQRLDRLRELQLPDALRHLGEPRCQ